jgi:inward rectifier potassium channel
MERVGDVYRRRFHELGLERRRVVFFPLHWVVVHPIDEASPLWGWTERDLVAADAELLVLMSAFDETSSQTVYARTSYKPQEIVWGARFKDMFLKERELLGVDMHLFHEIERLDRPAARGPRDR